jgi:uncharacterized protein YukE
VTLRVDTGQLVAHAGELYGDAYTFYGMHYYLGRVGEIPAPAWGDMPWSARWRGAWEQALGNRIKEADTIRDQAGEASGRILEAAANYAGTDVSATAAIDSTDPDTAPYVTAFLDGAGPLSARPGRGAPAPVFATPFIDPYGRDLRYPEGDPRWQALLGEHLPSVHPNLSTNVDGRTVSTIVFDGAEKDGLDDFIRRNYVTLNGADEVITRFAPGSKRPYLDVMLPAWRSMPSVIDNRARMVGSVGSTYTEMQRNLSGGLNRLKGTWQGSGADAYQDYAAGLQDYLGRIAAQATWLGSEGQKTAALVRDLRNQYAQLGIKHIKRINDLYQKYVATTTNVVGRLFDCTTPAGAAKALVGAVRDMTDEMVYQQDAAMDQALDLLAIEARAIAGSPNFDDPRHDAEPFPMNMLDTRAWDTGWAHR